MTRLYRPHIPVAVKVKVAERQLLKAAGDLGFAGICFAVPIKAAPTVRLPEMLSRLAAQFGCAVEDLRLDHDPPLGARQKRGEGKRTVYKPDANDPAHLFYRPHGPEHDGSHDIKTRVRGDHGQYSDIQLIKRQRRRERPPKPKKPWRSRPMPKGKSQWPKRPFPSKKDLR